MLAELLYKIIEDPEFPEHQAWRRRRFTEREAIVQAGDTDRKIYLVEEGSLRVSGDVALNGDKRVRPGLNDLGPGDLFGEVTLVGEKPRTASVTALSAGKLLEIDCAALITYMDKHRDTGYPLLMAIFRILVERFSQASERVEYFLAWGLKARGIETHL